MGGKYTPIGTQLDRTKVVNKVENDASLPDGVRFHVRRCCELLLDVRNKRSVAHLGSVDVNRMDSELVLRLCSWTLAEIAREFGRTDPDSAQTIVDSLSQRALPMVEDFGDGLLVLDTQLSSAEQCLLALHHVHPGALSATALRSAVKYQNATRFSKSVLGGLAKERWVRVNDETVTITATGISQIESVLAERIGGS